MIFEVDYIHSTNGQDSNFILSSLLYLKNGLIIKSGTSLHKKGQITEVSFLNNIFADMGMGISYEYEDILFDLNTYTYGPGGFVFAMGLSVRY